MNARLVDDVASAILYEGYLLYPYRASALKNQQRFNFGVVVPPAAATAGAGDSTLEAQVIARAAATATLVVRVRFLHLFTRRVNDSVWEEAVERVLPVESSLDALCQQPVGVPMAWPALETAGRTQKPITGTLTVSAERPAGAPDAFKISVRVTNTTSVAPGVDVGRQDVLAQAMLSTHLLLHVEGGEFWSLMDPPTGREDLIASCRNTGVWPVLVGEKGSHDAMLASPIILYDHPEIAPESNTDFFDGTEIDEMLVLRILTLTDAERQEMREGDARARQLLERTEALSEEHVMRLHGVLRGARPFDEEHAR